MEFLVELDEQATTCLIQFSDYSLWRCIEIPYRRTLAKELRIMTNPKINPGFFPRKFFEDGNHNSTHRPWQNCAADNNSMLRSIIPERPTNLFANTPNI